MSFSKLTWATAAVFACMAACGKTDTEESQQPVSGQLPCDVDEVLAKNCRKCHAATPLFGAPMPLVTYGDLHTAARSSAEKKVYELVGARIHDDAAPMPQPPNPRLGASDLGVIDRWVAAGAPSGSGACADAGTIEAKPQALDCTPDQKLRPLSKFEMKGNDDLYVCYGFDTTAEQKRHIYAGSPRIDNTAIVHHVLLYQAEAAVDGTPHVCGAGGGSGWRLVTGWAPGAKNFELPPEAGFAEEQGVTHWALQIHYNNTRGLSGEVDESGYDLCTTTDLRPNDADVLATGTMEISIPPRSTTETTCELTIPEVFGSINVVSSWAHMHRLGRAQYAKRVRAGAETTLLDAPAYDFNTGAGAQDVRVDVGAGDTVRTMCRWTNPSDATVGFGEKTADEMCYAFLTYYPKITIPRFHWAIPSAKQLSRCTSTSTK